ncbi:MAG: hypothetical protein NC311_00910 [Muribaculaceae bacterium]|nr:hypothetical protein [Muribaculaceae bacterium]
MLTGIRIFTSDNVWRQILAELGANIDTDAKIADVNFDLLISELPKPIPVSNLYVAIIGAMDNTDIVARVLGADVHLSRLPAQIVALLSKSGGMSGADLKAALGYAPNATTHTVDTAICGLRKTYGHDFIKNDNGVYRLGRV